MIDRFAQAQKSLQEQKLDGWLFYDFRRSNPLACQFLGIPAEQMLTRRFFYWLPAQGTAVKIVHAVEENVLKHLPGKNIKYRTWQELELTLSQLVKGRIAMEYSPKNAIPYLSKVDAGTIEVIREMGVEVVSSGDLLQASLCIWSESQLESHFEAAAFLDQEAARAWSWVSEKLRSKEKIKEYDLQQFILGEIHAHGFTCDDPPIVAVNAKSADPHYTPEESSSQRINNEDFILIDMTCKKLEEGSVYADITRVAVAAAEPTKRQNEIFEIVKVARNTATAFVEARLQEGSSIMGWEVDRVCRNVIEKEGYGNFFVHRTGHNLGEAIHGSGANLDDFETKDTRLLLPGTCFTIEPGIYLPGEFGVRLEYDIYIPLNGQSLKITGGIQDKINCLL